MDVLSDVLQTMRLQGALFLNGDMRAPWRVDIPEGGDIAHALKPGAKGLALCHLVLEGECWAQVKGGEPVLVRAGEVIAVPHGDPHLLGSGLHHAGVEIGHLMQPRATELQPIRYGGDGDRTVLVCGWFVHDENAPRTFLQSLPSLFTTSLRLRPAGAWIELSVAFVLSDASLQRAGGDVVASKIAEVIFAEAVRGYLEVTPSGGPGWLAGLADPHVGRCLALMHEHPGRAWTVDALADAVHVSRSALAERFTELVGTPPMQYLTRWRMVLAAGMLRKGQPRLASVAHGVGYTSEAAFNRAFKREYGTSPGAWKLRC